ncbi:MAG: hypothetical protein ACJ8H8_08110 [Geminicoccaceae bacterium]
MTDLPVQGLAEASSAGFVNGSARPAAAGRPSAKIRTAPTSAHHDEPKQDGPAASIWASSPAYWRHALLTSCRVQEALHGVLMAMAREQLAFTELASRRALEAGQALIAELDGARRSGLVTAYLRDSLERTVEHSALMLDLSGRPGGEVLRILAEAGALRA